MAVTEVWEGATFVNNRRGNFGLVKIHQSQKERTARPETRWEATWISKALLFGIGGD